MATVFFQFLLSLPVQRVMGSLAQYCSHHSFFQLKFYLKIIGYAHATVTSNTERCHIPGTQSPSVVTSHLNWQIDTGRVQVLTVQSSGGFLVSATTVPSLPPSLSRGKCSRLPQKAGMTLDLQIQDRDSGDSCQPSSSLEALPCSLWGPTIPLPTLDTTASLPGGRQTVWSPQDFCMIECQVSSI